MEEIWVDIKGYEGSYQVSNIGNVRSVERKIKQLNQWGGYNYTTYPERVLRLSPHSQKKYQRVSIREKANIKRLLVHRLVAETFVPNPNGFQFVNHIDSDLTNNKATNLEWIKHPKTQDV